MNVKDLSISVVAREDTFIVIDKPAGLPSAPLAENEDTAFSQIVRLAPEVALVRGKKEGEGCLIHRLDTATRGLLLAACTQSAFDVFLRRQEQGRFIKYYCAYCDYRDADVLSRLSLPAIVESRFRPYGKGGKKVKPVFSDLPGAGKADLKKAGSKIYRTEILSARKVKTEDGIAVVQVMCKIASGFRHQVRSHLAWLGLPVIGDSLYNENNNESNTENAEPCARLRFTACALEFDHPVTGRRLHFVLDGFKLPD